MSKPTILITGGARRLGAAVGRSLSEAGFRICIHYDRSESEARELSESLNAAGGETYIVQGNLKDEDSSREVAAKAHEVAGSVTHLVNNASIFPEDSLNEITVNSVAENMNVNALVPLFLGRALRESGSLSCVVNFLDTRTLDYDAKHVSYHLSKRTLQSLTAMMAAEWAPEVRVNGVAPGLILPPEDKDESYLESLKSTNPLNTYGGPEDITRSVLFLIESPFITGQTIYVDGGRHLKGRFYE